MYFMCHKSDAAETFRHFSADNCATVFSSDVETLRSDDGREFLEGAFGALCRKYNLTQEFTSASSPQFNGVAKRALGLIEAAALAAKIQASILFPNVELPSSSDYLWTEAMSWACHTFNCSATTSNPESKSPHEMWHGSPPRRHLLPFFKPGYYNAKRTNKSQPNSARVFLSRPRTKPPPGFCASMD